jgi:hypothetical protein
MDGGGELISFCFNTDVIALRVRRDLCGYLVFVASAGRGPIRFIIERRGRLHTSFYLGG